MSDRFRKTYRQLNEAEQELVEQIKDNASRFDMVLDQAMNHNPRYASLARTKLEEAVMWAVKAVTG